MAMSASPAATGAITDGSSLGTCWPSPSRRTARSYPCSQAYLKPVCTAPPIPRLYGRRRTRTPAASAFSAVWSTEPSETTTMSRSGSNARSSPITRTTFFSSLYAGTIAMRRSGDMRTLAEADEIEQPARSVTIGVLVQHALACAAAHLLRTSRVVEQLAVRGNCLLGVRHDEHFRARLEPALDPFVRVCDDRRARRR